MTIVNCTPHTITVIRKDGSSLVITPSGNVPRCSTTSSEVMDLDGIAVVRSVFGYIVDLPEPKDGTWLVVSRIVLNAAPARLDLLAPGELVRGADGQPIGCKGLSR
jgi:hypothetical protein